MKIHLSIINHLILIRLSIMQIAENSKVAFLRIYKVHDIRFPIKAIHTFLLSCIM